MQSGSLDSDSHTWLWMKLDRCNWNPWMSNIPPKHRAILITAPCGKNTITFHISNTKFAMNFNSQNQMQNITALMIIVFATKVTNPIYKLVSMSLLRYTNITLHTMLLKSLHCSHRDAKLMMRIKEYTQPLHLGIPVILMVKMLELPCTFLPRNNGYNVKSRMKMTGKTGQEHDSPR